MRDDFNVPHRVNLVVSEEWRQPQKDTPDNVVERKRKARRRHAPEVKPEHWATFSSYGSGFTGLDDGGRDSRITSYTPPRLRAFAEK